MPSEKPLIALRLDAELHRRVLAVAAEQGRSPSNLIAFWVREALDRASSGRKSARRPRG